MKPITFLQWNILYTEKPSNIIKLLKELDPDIIALQELTANFAIHNGQDVAATIAHELGYNYFAKLLPGTLPDSVNESGEVFGSGIFTRFPITNKQFSIIKRHDPSVRGGYDNESKAYVELTVDADSKEVTIGTAHLSYTHRFINQPRKRQEADNLLKILDTKKNNYLFAGDLNSRPSSYTIKNISKILKHAGPKFELKTWTTKPFSYRGFEETKLDWRLDYVFTTPEIDVISSDIVDTDYSDHLPIMTKFRLR